MKGKSWLRIAKPLLFGMASGALSIITLVLSVYLALAVFTLSFTGVRALIEADVTNSVPWDDDPWAFIVGSLINSIGNLLTGLRTASPAILAGFLLGLSGSIGHQIGVALYRKRQWMISFVFLSAAVVVPMVTWSFVQREQVAFWILESPELYSWRDLLLESYGTELFVVLVFALSGAYPVWAAWRWWYTKLADCISTDDEAIQCSNLEIAKQVVQSKVFIIGTGALLLFGGALFFPLKSIHDRYALHLQHGVFWLDAASQSRQSAEVVIDSDARKIRVVNVEGRGTVSVDLSRSGDPENSVRSIEEWSFEWRQDEYLYRDLIINELKPGEYHLIFTQQEGWGYFEYTLGSGGGSRSQITALALGFLAACDLMLGLGWISLIAIRVFR